MQKLLLASAVAQVVNPATVSPRLIHKSDFLQIEFGETHLNLVKLLINHTTISHIVSYATVWWHCLCNEWEWSKASIHQPSAKTTEQAESSVQGLLEIASSRGQQPTSLYHEDAEASAGICCGSAGRSSCCQSSSHSQVWYVIQQNPYDLPEKCVSHQG